MPSFRTLGLCQSCFGDFDTCLLHITSVINNIVYIPYRSQVLPEVKQAVCVTILLCVSLVLMGFYHFSENTVGEWRWEGRPTIPWRAVRHTWVHSTRQPLRLNFTQFCSAEPLLLSFFGDRFASDFSATVVVIMLLIVFHPPAASWSAGV